MPVGRGRDTVALAFGRARRWLQLLASRAEVLEPMPTLDAVARWAEGPHDQYLGPYCCGLKGKEKVSGRNP